MECESTLSVESGQAEAAARALLAKALELTGAPPRVKIHPSYRLCAATALNQELRVSLHSAISSLGVAGFLLPDPRYSLSIVPVSQQEFAAFERAAAGCIWDELATELGEQRLERLFATGVLTGDLGLGAWSGPVVPVLMRAKRDGSATLPVPTDPLSGRAVFHGARLPIRNQTVLAARLYLFNHAGVSARGALDAAARETDRVLSSDAAPGYDELPQSRSNPGWRFFRNRRIAGEQGSGSYKVYISPSVADLPRAVSELLELLPAVPAHTWKIGRGHFGITRCDKVCLYFHEKHEMQSAARLLAGRLQGISAQGVPFTACATQDGLVSCGADAPRGGSGLGEEQGLSWRAWVAEKLARGMYLSRTPERYPLSAAQSALWSVRLCGVEPSTWEVLDRDFWRH